MSLRNLVNLTERICNPPGEAWNKSMGKKHKMKGQQYWARKSLEAIRFRFEFWLHHLPGGEPPATTSLPWACGFSSKRKHLRISLNKRMWVMNTCVPMSSSWKEKTPWRSLWRVTFNSCCIDAHIPMCPFIMWLYISSHPELGLSSLSWI